MTVSNEIIVTVNGEEYTVNSINNDVNGNARYVMHYLALGIEDYDRVGRYGLKKYRGKWYGGGVVFQAVNLEEKVKCLLERVREVDGY